MEMNSILQHIIKVEPNDFFDCGFCTLSFHTKSEQKVHMNNHFERKKCLDCNKQIIRINDDWYELHTIDNCNKENVLHISDYDDKNDISQLIKQKEFESNTNSLPANSIISSAKSSEGAINKPVRFVINRTVKRKALRNKLFTQQHVSNDSAQHSEVQQLLNIDVRNKFKKQEAKAKNCKPVDSSTPDGMQICKIYNKTAKNVRSLNKYHVHKENVQTPKPKGQRIRSIDLRPTGPFTCDICNRKLKDFNTIRAHMRNMHTSKNPDTRKNVQTYTCDICSRVLHNLTKLRYHMSAHSKVPLFICNYCGRGFYTRPSLNVHENKHTGAKVYPCTICGKGFRGSSNLARHMRVHTGLKSYKCQIEGCDRAYMYSIDLKRHKFSVHRIYTKKYNCPSCSKVFPENKLLNKHLQSNRCSEIL